MTGSPYLYTVIFCWGIWNNVCGESVPFADLSLSFSAFHCLATGLAMPFRGDRDGGRWGVLDGYPAVRPRRPAAQRRTRHAGASWFRKLRVPPFCFAFRTGRGSCVRWLHAAMFAGPPEALVASSPAVLGVEWPHHPNWVPDPDGRLARMVRTARTSIDANRPELTPTTLRTHPIFVGVSSPRIDCAGL